MTTANIVTLIIVVAAVALLIRWARRRDWGSSL